MDRLELSKTELLASDKLDAFGRVEQTVLAPALNAALIEPWNAMASSVNAASKSVAGTELVSKVSEMQTARVEFLSTGWLVQSTAAGLGMLIPYTIAGKVAGAGMRKAGGMLNVGEGAARVLQSQAGAQIIGAAIYDGMRDTRPGETRIGNALGGAVAFSAFELGNAASKNLPLAKMLLARAATGAVGATTQHTVSELYSKGELPTKEGLVQAGLGGMVMNIVLPESQRALTKAVDLTRMSFGMGVPVDRYIQSKEPGKSSNEVSATLAELQASQPWVKVQTGARSNDFNRAKNQIELASDKSGLEKLGRELSRLNETALPEAEAAYKQAADLLAKGDTEAAFKAYRQLRLNQEAQAHHLENVIAQDLGKAKTVFSKGELAQEIGAWPAAGGGSQELRWRQEFAAFQQSAGKYRPGQSVPENLSEFVPAESKLAEKMPLDAVAARERKIATDVVRILQQDGHIAVFAGGSVRDEIMGRLPKDFDIATSAAPEHVEQVFRDRGYKVLTVGKQFGTVKAIIDGIQVEVTTLRNDGNYSDGRRPDMIEFATSLREDAARRDLTMNAIFKDPITNTYYDLFAGKIDIEAKLIRTVGDPAQRFAEDNLRMMRVPRFAARYDFSVEAKTLEAITANSPGINKVSGERIREELRGMLAAPKPSVGLNIMFKTGLMREVIPEMMAMDGPKGAQDPYWHPEGSAWEHTKLVVDQLALNNNGQNFPLMMTGLLHDIAKPLTQEIKPNGSISNPRHEVVGAEMAKEIVQRLKLSRNDSNLIEKLVAQHMRMHQVRNMRPGTLAELLRQPEVHDLIEFQNADSQGRGFIADGGQSSNREWLLAKLHELKNAPDPNQKLDAKPLVDGQMINSLNFPQSPVRKEILDAARMAQQEGAFSSAADGRAWVLQNYGSLVLPVKK